MNVSKEFAAQLLPANQQHLMQFWDVLEPSQQTDLFAQLQEIDFALIENEFQAAAAADSHKTDWAALATRAQPPQAIRLAAADTNPFSEDQALLAGEQALRSGKIAMVLVAGGQGTRLGFPHPKGMFPIGPVSQRTLFQVLIDLLRARAARYQQSIPLFIMTSPATHQETVAFLEQHQRFGLAADDLHIFCQGTMPAVDATSGEILLTEKHEIALSPDGHGGLVAALAKSGAMGQMQSRGIEQVFYAQIDNPLVQVCDPVLIGYHLLSQSELTTQVVQKAFPLERVGNVVSIDGRVQIIEYSDLPPSAAEQTNADGSTKLWAGNIAVHLFDMRFLQRVIASPKSIPFHLARKKVPFVDQQGRKIEPEQPNAIKFEKFIFDLLPQAERAIVVEGDKAEVFAPVKNAAGEATDTAAIAQQAIINLHSRWLQQAGAEVAQGVPVEISPLLALDAAELKQRISPDLKISQPTFLQP
jgi:UDP-N-acetylglucosamine/UDP-N-acetylgalactosamine diphosphorylase